MLEYCPVWRRCLMSSPGTKRNEDAIKAAAAHPKRAIGMFCVDFIAADCVSDGTEKIEL